jgi:hypothetical protein
MSNIPKIAPPELIARDFNDLSGRTRCRCTWPMERALLEIAVASHAHEGHGAFQGRKYPNTTEDHVARAVGLDANAERRQRQDWIDGVRLYAEAAIEGKAPRHAVDPDGMPLFGIGMFRWLEVEPRDVLVGLVIGGLRDDPTWRRKAQDTYGIEIGYGEAHPVNLHAMEAAGLDGYSLAKEGHEAELPELREKGVILPDTTPQGGDVQNLFIRYQTGPGASDDTAVLAAGALHGVGAAVGSYLADAIDTIEKYTPVHADQDNIIAEMIRAKMPALVTDAQVVHLTFLASTPPDMLDTLPDSTMRHFLNEDPGVDQCILESHFLYLSGRPWLPMHMGRYPLMNNEELYKYVEDRVARNKTPK